MGKNILIWLPSIFWMGLIFFLSSFPKIQLTDLGWANFLTRKFAHLSEYAILCYLNYRALKRTAKISPKKNLLLSFLIAVVYAVTDEYHQTFVPGRSGNVFDWGIDSLGAFLGMMFSWKFIFFLPEKVRLKIL